MNSKRLITLLSLLLIATAASVVSADSQALTQQEFNRRLAEHYLIPRYQALSDAMTNQYQILQTFCKAPDAEGLTTAREAFHETVDAWMAIQHVSLGPIALEFRGERINHWPEHRNVVAKSLSKRLAEKDTAALEPERFAKSSVAIQGLPALERLLFHDKSLQRYSVQDETSQFRCQLTLAIALNLKTISADVIREWREDVLPVLISGEAHPLYFETSEDVTRLLVTNLKTLFQQIIVLKLEKVLGEESGKAKPKLAENYRSGRSLRNIVLNLESARAMIDVDNGFSEFIRVQEDGAVVAEEMIAAYDEVISTTKQLPAIDEAVADPEKRVPLEQALKDIKAVRDRSLDEIPRAARVTLGFNELDGD